MNNQQTAVEAERVLALYALALLRPRDGECLACYLERHLAEFGCAGSHRFTVAYRDACAPRSTALVRRLADLGGCCCDCEVLLNVFWRTSVSSENPAAGRGWEQPVRDRATTPRCAGVRRGSTQPCAHWVTRRRR